MQKNKLLKLLQDNLNAHKSFKIKQEDDNQATIYLYEAIGWLGIEAEDFAKDLSQINSKEIHLRINSPGGDVFDARAMQTAIAQHPAKVIAHIDGVAASAATYLALAADEVHMAEGAFFMIHKGWTLNIGNADDFREQANFLDKIDQSIANDYHKRTNKPLDEIIELMASETWFTADEAKEHGFIDEIFENVSTQNRFNLSAYQHVPEQLQNQQSDFQKYRQHLERRLRLAL